jgi:hypothetical protein
MADRTVTVKVPIELLITLDEGQELDDVISSLYCASRGFEGDTIINVLDMGPYTIEDSR